MPDQFEINLARRVLRLHQLAPAINVLKLLQNYAHVEVTDIPLDVDAVCLNLKKPGVKPTVIINKSKPPRRRRFTMAHELGHILIPWHRGSIIDDASQTPDQTSIYYEMESEANRFASELLMPETWVKSLISLQIQEMPKLAVDISSIAEVSLAAAVFRLRFLLPKGFIFAELDGSLVVKSSWRSPGTPASAPLLGEKIDPADEFPRAESKWSLERPNGTYWWWKLTDREKLPDGSISDWRKLLVEILHGYDADNVRRKKAWASVSATAAMANNINESTVEGIYASMQQRFASKAKNDPLFAYLMRHPKISDYMASRARSFRD